MKKSETDEKKESSRRSSTFIFFKIISFSSYHDRNFDSKFFFKNFQFLEFTLNLRHQFATFRNFKLNIISLFIQFSSILFNNDQIARNVFFDTNDTTIEKAMSYTTNVHVDTLKTKTHFRFVFTNFVNQHFTMNDVEKFESLKYDEKKLMLQTSKNDETLYK